MWTAHLTLHRQLSFAVALQTHQTIGNEAVGKCQGEVLHVKCGVNTPTAFIIIGTAQQSHLFIVLQDAALNGVGIVILLQIDQVGADVTQLRIFVAHILYRHIADDREVFLLVLHDVEVAVQHTAHLRQVVRHH